MALKKFVRARLREDEGMALRAEHGPWLLAGDTVCSAPAGGAGRPVARIVADCPSATGLHIVRHHPDRVLAEVHAKQILLADAVLDPDGAWWTLRYLAAAYTEHPDWRPDWALPGLTP